MKQQALIILLLVLATAMSPCPSLSANQKRKSGSLNSIYPTVRTPAFTVTSHHSRRRHALTRISGRQTRPPGKHPLQHRTITRSVLSGRQQRTHSTSTRAKLPTEKKPPANPAVAEDGSYYGQIDPKSGREKVVFVCGYSRKDGSYVQSRYRCSPTAK